jgi:hypothetical protein
MVEPMTRAPESEHVAFGANSTIHLSDDFGNTWPLDSAHKLTLSTGGAPIYSLVFANDTRLFIGTTNGRVYRADLANSTWSVTRIDNAVDGPLGIVGLVSDIAIDWSDRTLQSIYICFGGNGDFRHVWRFNGKSWEARSGTGATSLIDVEHNAMVVDPANPSHVYVGTDIAVWSSFDNGNNWMPLQNGLPDAPVFDLQIHNEARLLRASTHGRGLYEYHLEGIPLDTIDLYIRHTNLDTGSGKNTDGRRDPLKWPSALVDHRKSPNIKVDVPASEDNQTPSNEVDFFQFHEVIVDKSDMVATIEPPRIIHNRVYVLIHNRGPFIANSVRVLAAITDASTSLKLLPLGYNTDIQANTPLSGPDWITLGTVTLNNLRPGFPQVAIFDLPSNLLPSPATLSDQSRFCLLSFIHSNDDPFTATERNVDILSNQEPKVARKDLNIVQFVG